ncbi:hypothetical protein BD779DRAFT_1675060 [Infundibulicybe gibba]|nr:hypothetical protein BD779DRAFT_1675060 [Infundibulicybe gibba]
MSTLQAPGLDALLLFWKHTIVTRYSVAGVIALYTWDFCITIQDEVEYFWKSSWTFVKFLYLLNRYFRIPTLLLDVYCKYNLSYECHWINIHLVVFQSGSEKTIHSMDEMLGIYKHKAGLGSPLTISTAITSSIGMLIVQVILQVRLYALYGRSKFLLVSVGILYSMQAAAVFSLIGFEMYHGYGTMFSLVNYPRTPSVLPTFMQTCNVAPVSSVFFAIGIPYVIFDFVLFALATSRSLRDYLSLPANIRGSQTLIGIMLRDSIIVFVITFLLNVANILTWEYEPQDLYAVLAYWTSLIPTVIANHMLINLKKVTHARISSEDPAAHTTVKFGWPVRGNPSRTKTDSRH